MRHAFGVRQSAFFYFFCCGGGNVALCVHSAAAAASAASARLASRPDTACRGCRCCTRSLGPRTRGKASTRLITIAPDRRRRGEGAEEVWQTTALPEKVEHLVLPKNRNSRSRATRRTRRSPGARARVRCRLAASSPSLSVSLRTSQSCARRCRSRARASYVVAREQAGRQEVEEEASGTRQAAARERHFVQGSGRVGGSEWQHAACTAQGYLCRCLVTYGALRSAGGLARLTQWRPRRGGLPPRLARACLPGTAGCLPLATCPL